MSEHLYHITSNEALSSILAEGIRPQIGKNSSRVGEKKPAVFLCDKDSIPFWQIILGNNVVLETDIPVPQDMISYDLYKEISFEEALPAKCIKRIYTSKPSTESMRELCLSHLDAISECLVMLARYYYRKHHPGSYTLEKKYIDSLQSILKNTMVMSEYLDYSVLAPEEIREHLITEGEKGEYTLCDTWCNTDKRLYQKLLTWEHDDIFPIRELMYYWIVNTLGKCLDTLTGGWDG